MIPVAFLLAGYPIYAFPLFLDVGIGAGLYLSCRLAQRRRLRLAGVLDVALCALAAALFGARAEYVASHWADYGANPITAFSFWEGGLALPGALTLGAAAGALASRWVRLALGFVLDAFAPGVALAQAAGHAGCALAGCALGRMVPPGSWLPAWPLPDSTGAVALRFPSQAFEAAIEALLALSLWLLWRRRPRAGTVAASYLVAYAAFRLAAEPLRGDAVFAGPLAVDSWWALAALLIGVGAFVALRERPGRTRARPGPTGNRQM